MRPRMLPFAAMLLLVAGLAAPAQADSTVVLRGNGGDKVVHTTCAMPEFLPGLVPGAVQASPVTDDPDLAVGSRALGYTVPADATDFAVGPMAPVEDLGAAGTFDVRAKAVGGAVSGMAMVFYYPDVEATLDYWLGYESLQLEEGWQTVDAEDSTLTWLHWDDTAKEFDDTAPDATRTEFVAANPGDAEFGFEAFAFGCGGAADFQIDRFRVGPTGDVTTYDYEAQVSAVSNTATAATVTAGQGVVLSSIITPDGISDAITLEARPLGASTFTVVGEAFYDWNAGEPLPARRTAVPLRHTQYRWHYPGNNTFESSYSPIRTVHVRTAVTMVPKSTRITRGKRLVVTGIVSPRTAGLGVVLQRKVSGVWKTWKSGTTTSTGSYVLKRKMRTTGRWYIRVVTASTAANLAGTSVVKRIRVVR